MRAKDSDRTETCQLLDAALGDGQLSMEEHRERVSAATKATTLGELQALVTDLQNAKPALAEPPASKPSRLRTDGWGIRAAMAAVLVLLGIGIGWGLYGNTSSPLSFTSDPGAEPDGVAPVVLTPPRQLQSLGGLTGLVTQMRQKFGDSMGYGLTVFPDYAVLERADPTEDRRLLRYTYRGGWDDPNTSPASSDDRLVDLGKFDPNTVIGVLRGAPDTLGIKPSDVTNTYLNFEPSDDVTAPPDTLAISVYVSTDFGGGYIALNPDGSIKRINYPSR